MSVASGQLTSADREALLDAVQSAQDNLDPDRLPDLESARARLLESIDDVKSHLDRSTGEENRNAWLAYLDMDPLVEAIDSEAAPANLIKEARILHGRLIGTSPGLEMPAVMALRRSVDHFSEAILFSNPDPSIANLKRQLQVLSKMLQTVDDCPSPDQFNSISQLVAYLNASGQAPQAVQVFRDTFDQPNVAIMIGSTLINEAIGRSVVRKRPVRDCILGTRLVGNALLTGDVRATLIPSDGTARVGLRLQGTVETKNTGYNGPVRLKTSSFAKIISDRVMIIDANSIQFEEISTQADLSTTIDRIDHKLALVRAIAKKQAARKKPAADRIGERKLREQVSSQFTSESNEVNPVTPTELLDRAEPMLNRLSLTRPTQFWSSTEEAISVASVLRNPDQLASAVQRPNLAQPFSLAIQIHESAIENAFTAILAGRTLNEKRLEELLANVSIKNEDEEEETESPFEISFSRSRPVIFEARSQSLRLGLRGTRFTQGNRAPLVKPIEITATYEPASNQDGKLVMRRADQVSVDFPNARLTLGEVGLKRVIQKEFDQIFPQEILEQNPRISEDAKIQSLRNREFQPSRIDLTDGWFSICFQ